MSRQVDVYNKLKTAIIYGELSPGEKLSEIELSKKLKSSRTPIREAFRQLQMEGYITMPPNKGASVAKIPVEQLDEIYDVICVLESHAAELSALKIGERELTELQAIQRRLIAYVEQKDYRKYIVENTEFHHLISRLSHNATLIKINRDLRLQIYRYRLISVTIPGYLESYVADHERIIQAMAAKDPALAGSSIRDHVQRVKQVLVSFLKANPGL